MSSRLLTLRNGVRLARSSVKPVVFSNALKCATPIVSKSLRFYSSNSSPATQLKEALKAELKFSDSIPNTLDPFYEDYLKTNGFEVIQTEGQSNVQLVKTTEDGEIIRVFFDIDQVTDVPVDDAAAEEVAEIEEEVQALDEILCYVKVIFENPQTNKGIFINLSLQGSESTFMIDYLNHKDDISGFVAKFEAEGEYFEKVKYQGPRFSDLDESIQTGFENYLDARGINDNLAEFILMYSEIKEENEYRKWLSDLASYL